MWKGWCLLPLLCALVTAPAPAAGLRLVTGSDYAPFTGQDLPQGGMTTELVAAAFAAVGRPLEPVEFLPWRRGYEAVRDGAFDATFPYVDTPARRGEMLFSEPIYTTESWPVFREDRVRSYAGPESLAGLTLCQPVGYAVPASLQPLIAAGQVHLVQPGSMRLCARQLFAGHIDFLITSTALFNMLVRSEWTGNGPAAVLGDAPVGSNPFYLLVAKSNPQGPDILAALAAGLDRLRADGRYQAIVRRHLGMVLATQ